MFWGLVIVPGKKYTQIVDKSFHVSMAVLEAKDNDNNPASLMIEYDNREFILCVLQKNRNIQCNLDLNFEKGDEITFFMSGSSSIHITGYLIAQDEDESDDEDESEQDSMLNDSKKSDAAKRKVNQKVKEGMSKKAKKDLSNVSSDNSMFSQMDDEDDDSDEEVDDFGDLSDEDDSEESGSEDENKEDSDEDSDEDSEEDTEDVKKVHPPTPFAKKSDKKIQQQKMGKTPDVSKEKVKTPKGTPSVNILSTPQMKTPNVVNGTPEQSSKKKKKKNKDGSLNSSVATPGTKATTPGVTSTPSTPAAVKKTLEGGVIVEDTKVGNGPVAKAGSVVSVYYTGRLKQNNKQFDSATKGNGFKFRLGHNEVIRGWDIGVSGMKVGGKRKIIVPANLGYGSKGALPHIPPNSPLVFEVELLKIK